MRIFVVREIHLILNKWNTMVNFTEMVIEKEIKVGRKYRFVSQSIDEIVTITERPIKNSSGFLEYGARNKYGVYRICFNDELFKIETSDSICH